MSKDLWQTIGASILFLVIAALSQSETFYKAPAELSNTVVASKKARR